MLIKGLRNDRVAHEWLISGALDAMLASRTHPARVKSGNLYLAQLVALPPVVVSVPGLINLKLWHLHLPPLILLRGYTNVFLFYDDLIVSSFLASLQPSGLTRQFGGRFRLHLVPVI